MHVVTLLICATTTAAAAAAAATTSDATATTTSTAAATAILFTSKTFAAALESVPARWLCQRLPILSSILSVLCHPSSPDFATSVIFSHSC